MDFVERDVQLRSAARRHYIENLGDTDPTFLEVFPTPKPTFSAEWLAHTPSRLVNGHIFTGEDFANIPKKESVVMPI